MKMQIRKSVEELKRHQQRMQILDNLEAQHQELELDQTEEVIDHLQELVEENLLLRKSLLKQMFKSKLEKP